MPTIGLQVKPREIQQSLSPAKVQRIEMSQAAARPHLPDREPTEALSAR